MRSVRAFVVAAMALTMTAVACAGSGDVVRTSASADTPSSGDTGGRSPDERLDALTRSTPGTVQRSAIVSVQGRPTAVVLSQTSLADRRVRVLVDDDGWTEQAVVRLPEPRFDLDASRPVEIADVTGDAEADFLVPLTANHDSAVLVSRASGDWGLVPFAGPDGDTERYVGVDPRLSSGTVTSMDRICVPNCAQGSLESVSWAYRDGTMVRAG